MKIFKTIKFRLTFWYTFIFYISSLFLVLLMNILLTRFFNDWIRYTESNRPPISKERPVLKNLNEEQRIALIESRKEELKKIRRISIYTIFPLLIFSFLSGYVLSESMLQPIENINKEIDMRQNDDLIKPINYENNGDEISQLVQSFNKLFLKVNTLFETQQQFVENASHEIKTPLTVIQANIDSILLDKDISKTELIKLIKNAKDQIGFMNKLLDDLLLLSLPNEVIIKEKVDLLNLFNSLIDNYGNVAKEKDIKLGMKFNTKKSVILANEILLKRAFGNLIENSIKYSGGNKIIIDLHDIENKLELFIMDDGVGIPDHMSKKVFDRFFRIDKSRSRKTGGSGLGLAITKRIVEYHGGDIYVDSDYKYGAKFVIKLPIVN